MNLAMELDDEGIVLKIPRLLIEEKIREKYEEKKPNISKIINDVLQDIENAISQREEQESNQREHQDRSGCGQASKASCCNSNECSRQEEEEEEVMPYVSNRMYQIIRNSKNKTPDLSELLHAMLIRISHMNDRIEELENIIFNEEI